MSNTTLGRKTYEVIKPTKKKNTYRKPEAARPTVSYNTRKKIEKEKLEQAKLEEANKPPKKVVVPPPPIRKNNEITHRVIFLIDKKGLKLGEFDTKEALKLAVEQVCFII
jgi:hypothetical protein